MHHASFVLPDGGIPFPLHPDAVVIYRKEANGEDLAIAVDMRKLLRDNNLNDDIQLYHGDRVMVRPKFSGI